MQPSSRGRGRGRGKGKGRGRGCGKLEEEERTDMGGKPKEKQRKTSKRKQKKCKDTADSGPEWNEEMTEEWAKWKWGEVWAEWDEDKWDCCDAKRSADRAANLDAQVSLHQLAIAFKKHKGSKPATDKTNPDDNAGDDNQETETTDGKKTDQDQRPCKD